MKTYFMNPVETTIAASNLNAIEHALGHKVPTGMVDSTSLSERFLTPTETAIIAANIRNIESSRDTSGYPMIVAYIFLAIFGISFSVIIISSVISGLMGLLT